MSFSMPATSTGELQQERRHLHGAWWIFLVMGILSIIVGMLAISSAFVATMASVFVFGVLCLAAGISEVIHGVMVRNWRGFALHLLAAVLYLLTGLFMLQDPVRAASVLTLIMAAAFFAGGLMRILFAVILRFPAWPWVLINGLVDLLLGVFIWSGWPESSLWVLGVFLGIDLIFHGWAWVALALSARKLAA